MPLISIASNQDNDTKTFTRANHSKTLAQMKQFIRTVNALWVAELANSTAMEAAHLPFFSTCAYIVYVPYRTTHSNFFTEILHQVLSLIIGVTAA